MDKYTPDQRQALSRFLVKSDHLIINGLAGTGKSYQIDQAVSRKVESFSLAPKQICALTFDRKLRDKYSKDYSWSNEMNTFTVHSLCFRVLKDLNLLPEIFIKVEGDDVDKFPAATSMDFDKLISLFLDLSDEELMQAKIYKEYFRFIKIITCDEVQDFREDYLKVVKKLKGLGDRPQVILAGDIHQKIYSFSEKASGKQLTEVLSQPRILLGDENYSILILNENHRVGIPIVIRFLNGYLRKVFQTEEKLLYCVLEGSLIGDTTDIPSLSYFPTREHEFAFVKNEVIGILGRGCSVAILGRSNKDIERYEALQSGYEDLTVSTIHKKKGDQSEYVFLVGFDYDSINDPEIKTIIYTAISRAKKKLYIGYV